MKKIIILTQKVDINDSNLGFFHEWLEKFSKNFDKVYVVCLWKGDFKFADNVEVFSMGKEKGVNKLVQFFRLQAYLLRRVRGVDGVFIHMGPIYAISSFPIAKLFGKKMLMWYVHRSRNAKLWLAEKLVDKIYTASASSFKIKSRKVEIVGHGVNTDKFSPKELDHDGKFKILFVGRVSPIKDLGTLVEAVNILAQDMGLDNFNIEVVGDAVDSEEQKYFVVIKKAVEEEKLANYFSFVGGLRHGEMPKKYNTSDALVNLSPTGGMDKAVLEAMSCGIPVLVANETFKALLSEAGYSFMFQFGNAKDLAEKIMELKNMSKEERRRIGFKLRNIVVERHNLDNLVKRIAGYFSKNN